MHRDEVRIFRGEAEAHVRRLERFPLAPRDVAPAPAPARAPVPVQARPLDYAGSSRLFDRQSWFATFEVVGTILRALGAIGVVLLSFGALTLIALSGGLFMFAAFAALPALIAARMFFGRLFNHVADELDREREQA